MRQIEEKTLADHDINVRSIRQELQLLEEQLKKHGRNEHSQSPTAQQKWIPVTEKLPENKQEVLVTEYGETDIGRRFDGRWVDRYGDKMKDVTAWAPLPEPYREEGEADEGD